MNYDYKFTKKAEEDLDNILKYISLELKNRKAAKIFLFEINKKIKEISLFSEMGELVNNNYISKKGIRKVIIKSYILYYLTDEKEKINIILRIIYGKRNMMNILNNL